MTYFRLLLIAFVFTLPIAAEEATTAAPATVAPATMRVDYYHTGDIDEEIFSLDRVVIEPLPWPGNPDRPIDDLNLGKYLFEVRDADSNELFYSRGFASIYGEWETTGEAKKMHRTFHESLRFPKPEKPVRIVLKKRDAANDFVDAWTLEVDPDDIFVDPSPPRKLELLEIQKSGDPAHKVDLLLLGDGYMPYECSKFRNQARQLTTALFKVSPFAERRDDFNVWGLCPGSRKSGVSRPSTGIHHRSPVGATYDAFGSERYVLTFENRAWRDIASWAPYDFVEILVNNETYGGGGIFGLFGTVAADNEWAEYLFIHEFGHHFAGLADEYYTSSVAYEIPKEKVEPWEVNVTVHPEDLKWKDLVADDTPIPTPWPKEEFDQHAREIQKRRREIRAEGRPESEMSALFEEQRAYEMELLGGAAYADRVGAFEGANYASQGTYRSEIDSVMFSRNNMSFNAVCQRGIEQVIDLYTDR